MSKYTDLSEIDRYKIKNHISNLVQLCNIDGKFSKSEGELLLNICERYGLPRMELIEIMKDGYATDYIIPANTFEKIEQLYDFVQMTLADKKLDPQELKLVKNLAKVLNIKTDVVNNLILTMVEYIQDNKPFEAVKRALYNICS